jgi:hypothetical protein
MPNSAAKIDGKVGSKIPQKSAESLVFFGQPTFLLCSGGDLNPLSGFYFPLFSMVFSLGNFHQGRKQRKGVESKL